MGVKMKKIIICLFCLIAFNAHATEMCARRDVTVIPLDATVLDGAGNQQCDNIEWIWWGNPSYGKIYGTATCLSLHEVREIVGDSNLASVPGDMVLPTDDYELMGRYGYYNGDTSIPENERKYCFCKLTHPMSSRWTYNNVRGDFQTCIDFCSDFCGRALNNMNYQRRMFNSIGK